MKQFVSQSAICWSWLSKLVMSTSIKIENQSSHPLLLPIGLQRALFLLRIWNDRKEWLLWKNVRKQNFNYCNESFWRGIESVAFVWSRRELILASSAVVIHHQLNNTVCGGEYDKKHGREKASERGKRYCIVSVNTKESQMFTKSVIISLITNTNYFNNSCNKYYNNSNHVYGSSKG